MKGVQVLVMTVVSLFAALGFFSLCHGLSFWGQGLNDLALFNGGFCSMCFIVCGSGCHILESLEEGC